jgi:hypothetical protein
MDYDWLGDGVYFWDHNARRAFDFASEVAKRPHPSGQKIKTPAVVGAIIDLGYCLNLLDSRFIKAVSLGFVRDGNGCGPAGMATGKNPGGPFEPVGLFFQVMLSVQVSIGFLSGASSHTLKRSDNSFLVDTKIDSRRDLNPKVPENLSNLVMDCVRVNPAKRPEFSDVIRRLEIIQFTLERPSKTGGSVLVPA